MRACLAVWSLSLGLACRPSAPPKPPLFDELPYAEQPASPNTQVFLVAGGSDIANFAAEVIEQRAMWIEAGVPDERIACYYAKPSAEAWQGDAEQFETLAQALAGCHRANAGRVFDDMRRAAKSNPPWLYIYVSAHGLASWLDAVRRAPSPTVQATVNGLSDDERAVIDQAIVGLDAEPGPSLTDFTATVNALRSGTPVHQLLFTPDTLGASLAMFPPATLKVVVLQACYSGAFLQPPLTEVDNLVAITATRADRPSFGCSAAAERTYFGGAFNRALSRELTTDDATAVNWQAIYDLATFAVESMEKAEGEKPSHPQWLDTRSEG